MALKTSRQGAVLVVTLDRASAGNALDIATQRELVEAWRDFEGDDALAVAVLQGDGGVFSIGHDREELLTSREGLIAAPELLPLTLSKPVIAAIEGPCYGLGCELALACDLRVAAEGSLFGFPDRNLLAPYRVASVLLPRLTFLGLALELLLTGRLLTAPEQRDFRLAAEVTPRHAALDRAMEIATRLSAADAPPLRKALLWQATGRPLSDSMQLARAGLLQAGRRERRRGRSRRAASQRR